MPSTEQQVAHLRRAHEQLGHLIAAMAKGRADEGDWLLFYDAASFISGLEDAASECAACCRQELNLDSEGYPLDADGYPVRDDGWGWQMERAIPAFATIPPAARAV